MSMIVLIINTKKFKNREKLFIIVTVMLQNSIVYDSYIYLLQVWKLKVKLLHKNTSLKLKRENFITSVKLTLS